MRYRGPTIVAAAIVLIGGLAACTGPTPSAGPSAGPIASPGPVSSTPPSTTGGGTPSADPARTKPPRPTASPSDTWDDVNFDKVMSGVMKCPDHPEAPSATEFRGHKWADLTGDGRVDAVEAASCYTTTAANQNIIVVFDGRHPTATPRPLLIIGRELYLQGDVQIKTSGRTVTVVSNALSEKASRCCADLKITQAYKWTGSHYTRTSYKKERR